MLLPSLRPFASQPTNLLRSFPALVAIALTLFLTTAPRTVAQSATAAEIAPSALPGRTLTLNGVVALAPFTGTGVFTITFTDTTYTMPVAAGNPAAYSGTYSAFLSNGATVIRLNGYLVSGSPVLISLVPGGAALIPGAFAMTADGVAATKTGTFTISGGGSSGGGSSAGGAPVVTSPTTARATVGAPFTFQITTNPATTSFTNTGGNAPVAINPSSGLVSGQFNTAGTFTFSFTALNASGASAITTVTVTATTGSTGGGTGGSSGDTGVIAAPANLVGYRNRVGQTFQFTVTGANAGAVWGTDVYTDDSSVARAAVHAGVLAIGETRTVTVSILPGQASYPASTRHGISSASWGSWAGSFAFAGAGSVTSGTAVAATARPALAPGFVAPTTTLAAGGRLVLPIAVTGGGTYTYQWYLNNVRLTGATANPYIVDALTAANAGTYTVDVTNALGTVRLTAGTITVGAAGSPVLALQPVSKTIVPGGTFTVAASASGSGLTYQWFRNGTPLAGETGAILLRNNASAADAGNYTVRVTNANGAVTSNAATITLSPDASRPANISVRTAVATGATVIPGFVVQGTGTKRVLIRAVGPGLAAFGLGGTMADPKLTVFQGSTEVATNDNWSAAAIGNAFSATGAFALPNGSRDAALLTDLPAGRDYTVQVTNASGTGGIVLIEVYDADALRGNSTSKLVNVSVRGQTAPGDDVLTLGLVIGGTGPRTLLVRGIGPKLASFGVTGTVADPRLQIFDSQQRAILANDDWGSADFVSELALASTYVGAFPLDAGSRDAATLSLVQPGAYTIQVLGAAAAPTGEALVEVYEVP